VNFLENRQAKSFTSGDPNAITVIRPLESDFSRISVDKPYLDNLVYVQKNRLLGRAITGVSMYY
jgi:hypothetical protein